MQRSALQRLAACAGARDLQWRCLKTETGIVGLAVDPKAREHLREKVLSVLDTIKVVPETAEYRKNLESTFSARCALRLAITGLRSALSGWWFTALPGCRLRMVDDASRTDQAIEDELGIQLEQAIKECNDELGLIPKMAEWQPWDVPADYTVRSHSLRLTCWL